MTKIKFHPAPEGYSYEFQKEFKRNVVRIMLNHHCRYDYNSGEPVATIWGFLNTKTNQFHAPVNSTSVGNVVSINKTTPYTAMQLCQSPSWYTP
jgi:hypothetical protein